MKTIYDVKRRYAIRLKFVENLFNSLTKLMLEGKASTSYTIKENLLLYCCKFLNICCRCHNFTYFHNKVCIIKT